MLKLENWHCLNYKSHFCFCVQRKTDAFLDVYGRFWKFQEVSQSCNMLKPLKATSHLSVSLTAMRMTINEVSSHLCKILTLIIVETYLQTEETLPHRSTHSCNMWTNEQKWPL